jgi:outer membrane biosynthesis protein TonB
LALHGVLFFVRARHGAQHVAAPTAAPPELVEVEAPDLEPAPEAPATPDTSPSAEHAGSATAAAARAAIRAPEVETASSDSVNSADAPSGTAADAPAAPAAVASAEAPARKINLGLDGTFFMRPPSEELPRVRKPEYQRQMEAAIAADEVKHGLARGNAFVGPLNAAAREFGPTRGEALLRVTVGADGALTDLEFLQGSASEWAEALKSFRELASRKRVRVPAGARGVRVTFAVKAKVQTPSGHEVKGVDVASPSLAPDGLLLNGKYDLADLGGGPQRMVYAHVVSEEVL